MGGVRWLPDDSGFTYEFIPETDKNTDAYLLNVETILYSLSSQGNRKKIIFSKEKNPEIGMKSEDFPEVNFKAENSTYMFANIAGASYYADYYYAPINKIKDDNISWKVLYKKEDLVKNFQLSDDNIIFSTSKEAPNGKICRISLKNPNINEFETLVEEDSNAVISDFTLTSEGLFYVKTKNGVSSKLYQLKENRENEIRLPGAFGFINLKSKGEKYSDLWIETEGWASKKERYRFDFSTNTFEVENLSEEIENNNLNDVVIEEIEIISHDGVKVPLSIIYKKGTKKTGNNSLLINAYGAYQWVNRPHVYPYLEEWINNNGIYAVAYVRGGGEKGESWYRGGFKKTKFNSWKDLIACTEYLINEKYTSKEKMSAWGGSAGGITIGRAITERPDLFAAAVIRVGMFNMVRSEFGSNGKNNIKEFGTVKDSIEFKALLEMDAYHHIKKGVEYPAIYLTAGMNDSRVPAWQPAKFAARLQANSGSNNPILLDVDFEGGHGFEASAEKKDQELAKIMTFLFWQTGHPDYQPKK